MITCHSYFLIITLKDAAKAPTVDLLRFDTLKGIKSAF